MSHIDRYIIAFFVFLFVMSTAYADNHDNKPSWDKICETKDTNTICQISFGQNMDYGDQIVWYSRVGVVELNGEQKKLFIHAPLGVKIQSGVLYQIDDNQTNSMPYNACYNVQGCQGLLEIDDTIIQQLKDGNVIKMRFISVNGKAIDASVSLMGFTKAYNK